MAKPIVFVFARAPLYGAVKSRLARDIGALAASRFYRNTLARLLRHLARDARFDVVLATTPMRVRHDAGVWPARLKRVDQGHGDLGQRMMSVLRLAGPRPALLIGSDIPDARAHHLIEALKLLGRANFVLGPVHDGGYWLIGAHHPSRLHRDQLQCVRWSTRHAFADSRDRLASCGRVAVLRDTLMDVDDLSALRAVQSGSGTSH